MVHNLSKTKDILYKLQQEIAQKREIREKLEKSNLGIAAQSEKGMNIWKRHEAYCWIFADSNYFPLMERNLDGAFVVPSISDLKALPLFNAWRQLDRDVLRYEDKSANYVISPPSKNETIFEYLTKISQEIERNKRCKVSIWRSLRSFLAYLREVFPSSKIGFIENIFPKCMEVKEFVVRKIKESLYPLDIFLTAQILQNLSKQIMSGPKNVQHVAAQALTFCWLCLYSAHARLRSEEKMLYGILQKSLKPPSFKIVNPWADHDYPTLILPSFFGEVEIPISCHLEKFLGSIVALDSERIFSSPLPSLRRAFDRAVKQVPVNADLGEITFLRMTSFPHEFV